MDKKERPPKKHIPTNLYNAWKNTAERVVELSENGNPTVMYELATELVDIIFDMSEGSLKERGLTNYVAEYLSLIISKGFIPQIVNERGAVIQPESMDAFNAFFLNFIEEVYQPKQKKKIRERE